MGEASDDRQWEEEDHVLGHFSRHRHHMCRLVALRPHWPHGRGDQTRLATPTLHQPIKHYCTSHFLIQHRLPAPPPPPYHTAVLTFPPDCSVAYGTITFLWLTATCCTQWCISWCIHYLYTDGLSILWDTGNLIWVSRFNYVWAGALIVSFSDDTFTARAQFFHWSSNTY